MTTNTYPVVVADRAADAARELARLTRPAITDLNVNDLYALTRALAELAVTLPQILAQLSSYLDPNTTADARACLAHARHTANDLAAAVDTAHQTLGNTAENIRTEPRGVQFSTDDWGSAFDRR